jgi:uncharacterized SAM-binding protein YcdF (DUF218 family)
MTAVDADPTVGRRRSRVRRTFGIVAALVVAFLVIVPVAVATHVVLTSHRDDRTTTDAIVVLGAAQFDGRPSPVLEARLAHAHDLFEGQVAPRIVTVGANQPGDRTTEAQAGKQWLVSRGVPEASIHALPFGSDTLGSLTEVAHLMARRGWSSATIVTDPAHEARSLAMARALGITAYGSPTSSGSGSSLTVDYVARETAGLLTFWFGQRWRTEAVVTR